MRCPHCHVEILRKKALVIEHNGEKISLRELSRMSGIAYSTLQNRYDRGWRGEELLGEVDKRKSSTKVKPQRSETSDLMRHFLSGSAS
jgi:hypothetical protein